PPEIPNAYNATNVKVSIGFGPVGGVYLKSDLLPHVEEVMSKLSLADHATIANMSPEYGATMGFFPVDHVTLQYLKLARISDDTVSMIEAYLQANKMFVDYNEPQIERVYSSYLELNLVLQPWVSGPKSPHDRVVLSEMKTDWHACLDSKVGFNETYLAGTTFSTFLNEIQPLGAEDNCQRSEEVGFTSSHLNHPGYRVQDATDTYYAYRTPFGVVEIRDLFFLLCPMRKKILPEACKETQLHALNPQSWLQVERGKLTKSPLFSPSSMSRTPILPFYNPVDYVEVLAQIHEELESYPRHKRSNLYLLQFQVFRGLEEVKLLRRSLLLAWQKASTIHEKIVFGAWLKYEKLGEELISELLASCGKCAQEFGPIGIAS
ncbi:hypothetical protein IFM89_033951, partial [Coptis chinensis]